jgi:hypothetical protein
MAKSEKEKYLVISKEVAKAKGLKEGDTCCGMKVVFSKYIKVLNG